MDKDFDGWNELKKRLDKKADRPRFQEREIWWCHLGLNVGDEENGKNEQFRRPVLIIKRASANLLVALPLSTSLKNKHYYFQFEFKGRTQSVILSQIRILDCKRLTSRMGSINECEFNTIKEKAIKMLV